MVTQVSTYRSDSGKLHEDEHKAWVDDLDHWLANVANLTNHGIRVELIRAVQSGGERLREIMEGLERTAPPAASAPPQARCKSCNEMLDWGEDHTCPGLLRESA
jgi:hypothetical protein